MKKSNIVVRDDGLDSGMLIFGLLVGLAIGGVVALLNAPRSGRATRSQITEGVAETSQTLREKIDSVVPTDSVTDSIAEGKAAARRRRAELGLTEAE